MSLKMILLTLNKQLDEIYDKVVSEITEQESMLGEQVAEELVSIDGILQDYTSYYSKEPIELDEIESLELLPEFKDKEQELITQLFYYIYLYTYFTTQNGDRIIKAYDYLVVDFFWQAWYLICYSTIITKEEHFYGSYLWLGGFSYLFSERARIVGPNELSRLMFTKEGREELEEKGLRIA